MSVTVGRLRPSQAVTQFGPGSLIDQPTVSMIVAGLDDWSAGRRLDEPRLARLLGVDCFREPPYLRAGSGGGIPARLFPRFLVCPRCRRLADRSAFEFDPRRRQYLCRHADCPGKGQAIAYPARFMIACPKGHLDDFPWHVYSHDPGTQCNAELRLEDSGNTGSITDLWIKCQKHGTRGNLGQAFGESGRRLLPRCRGRRPWLNDFDPKACSESVRALLRGASNAYFPAVASALSIPPWSDPLQLAVGEYVDIMGKVDSLAKLEAWLALNSVPSLDGYAPEQIWKALETRRSGAIAEPGVLRKEEWGAFHGDLNRHDLKSQFQARTVAAPSAVSSWLSRVLAIERLREVRALRGFNRIDSVPDIGDMGEVEAVNAGMAPLHSERHQLNWLPGIDYRGEGMLLELTESLIAEWTKRPQVQRLEKRQQRAQEAWFAARALPVTHLRSSRYILLHTLSHLLIRQLAIDCGYSSASLRERIYSSDDVTHPMAGILIYTATADSEGSLGGLVELTRPDALGPLLHRALRDAQLCANDPLCADREPDPRTNQLNGAACHACLLISETSCEAGNSYLDRSAVVSTMRMLGAEFHAATG